MSRHSVWELELFVRLLRQSGRISFGRLSIRMVLWAVCQLVRQRGEELRKDIDILNQRFLEKSVMYLLTAFTYFWNFLKTHLVVLFFTGMNIREVYFQPFLANFCNSSIDVIQTTHPLGVLVSRIVNEVSCVSLYHYTRRKNTPVSYESKF